MIAWMTILIYLQAGMTGLKLVIPEQSAEQLPNFTELGKTRLREENSKKIQYKILNCSFAFCRLA
jgi:hypothetical protein